MSVDFGRFRQTVALKLLAGAVWVMLIDRKVSRELREDLPDRPD